jgi:hypothetical protein
MQRIITRCSPFVRPCFGREGYGTDYHGSVPDLKNMRSWTERLGHSKLRSFTDKIKKATSGWSKIRQSIEMG